MSVRKVAGPYLSSLSHQRYGFIIWCGELLHRANSNILKPADGADIPTKMQFMKFNYSYLSNQVSQWYPMLHTKSRHLDFRIYFLMKLL